MSQSGASRVANALLPLLLAAASLIGAQSASQSSPTPSASELKYVVIVSRHGVRSPTGKSDQLNLYSAKPWPAWTVPPGYLTEHGAKLMTLFGAYDRDLLTSEGIFTSKGCADAVHVSIIADSDQRTRETGKALAAGMFPACTIAVQALAEGTPDPLFHSLGAGVGHPDKALAAAAVSGRIGGNAAALAEAYRPQLDALEEVLLGCKPGPACAAAKASLYDVPSSLAPGKGDHLVDLRSPLGTAATMAENLLLEYTEGLDAAQVGWGRVDANKVRELMQLHTANVEVAQRTSYIARVQSSNLLQHILNSMQQAATGKSVTGALGKPGDRLLLLVGHDTNLENIGGALGISWIIDGRWNDTPPGGALVLELWKDNSTGEYSVRTSYMAQTLDQMRNSTPLTIQSPPQRVPIFVPACSQAATSCSWKAFQQAVQAETNSAFVK
ncbi:MAG: histidine-type phosphatase [Terracidiphilus sp.]|jgi:4-phytase/acid phosphatase